MNIIKLGLQVYLNKLNAPVTKVELCKALKLHHWDLSKADFSGYPEWEEDGAEFGHKAGRSYISTDRIDEELLNSYDDAIKHVWEPNFSMPESHISFRLAAQFHPVYKLVDELIEEGELPEGIVYDPMVNKEISGCKLSIKESVLFFNQSTMPSEDCLWEFTSWWHKYADLPYVVSRDNCECKSCDLWRQKADERSEQYRLKGRYTRLINEFKEAVRDHAVNMCSECSKEFTYAKENSGSSYFCVPRFSMHDALHDLSVKDFVALCGSCRRTKVVKEKYSL